MFFKTNLLLSNLQEHLHSRHEVRHLGKRSSRNQSRNNLHARLVVVLVDVLQDSVETLQGGGGQNGLPQLVVQDVELQTHVLKFSANLRMAGSYKQIN